MNQKNIGEAREVIIACDDTQERPGRLNNVLKAMLWA